MDFVLHNERRRRKKLRYQSGTKGILYYKISAAGENIWMDFEAMKQNVDFCAHFAFFAFFLQGDRTVCFVCF